METPSELLEKILQIICDHYDVSAPFVMERTRKNPVVWKRQLFFHFGVKHLKERISLKEIGQFPCKKYKVKSFDHSTVIHSFKTVQNVIEVDKALKIDYDGIEEKIQYLFEKKEKPKKEVLEKIKILLNQTGLTIEQLSRAYDVSISHIERYLNGEEIY